MADILSQEEINTLLDVCVDEDDVKYLIEDIITKLESPKDIDKNISLKDIVLTYDYEEIISIINSLNRIKRLQER